ncbi:MAG: hypothetical protein KGL39_17850 [Patescibacteria group bacterium]|nr:hypothetical protein [Patescibacteria group bacterium]
MSHNTFPSAEEGVFTQAMRKRLNHNTLDISTSSADLTATSKTTQVVIPGLVTDTLEAGYTYQFEAHLKTTQTTNGGLTVEFNTPDTLKLTSIIYETTQNTASAIALAQGTTATMGTKLVDNKTAAYLSTHIRGSFIVKVAGKFELTAAQNTSSTDTTTVHQGSTLRVWCQANDTLV